jgi:sulfate transport system permease protein
MSATLSRSAAPPLARPLTGARAAGWGDGALLGRGVVALYLSLIVLIPLAAVVLRSFDGGLAGFWRAATAPQAVAALRLSLGASLLVSLVNAVAGTLISWVLVRDDFPGKAAVNAIIDLPFALPTIVAGLTLLALYGPKSPLGVNIAYSAAAVVLALLFVTLPFVARAVQPVLAELDRDCEEAAASLGAGRWTVFRLVILPSLLPAILAGVGLGFARAVGEFGSVVLISGNIPFQSEVAAVRIYGQVENDRVGAAAAISVVLLAISLGVLLAIDRLERWSRRHEG